MSDIKIKTVLVVLAQLIWLKVAKKKFYNVIKELEIRFFYALIR